MEIQVSLLAFIIWDIIGAVSFLYFLWYIYKEITLSDLLFSFIIGILGPIMIAIVAIALIPFKDIILFKKKKP